MQSPSAIKHPEIDENVRPTWTTTLKKKLKANLYRWHRVIGLLTVIPVIFWCLSGLMHPFMAHWFKPKIAREFMIPMPLDKSQLNLSIQDVLNQHKIKLFKNFRIVSFENNTYYQLKTSTNELLYYDTKTGELLENGDARYAEWLARYFLDDATSKVKSMEWIAEFSQEYKYVNRLLPVWKVSFERSDEMDVYVETASSRMGTFNPTSRKVFLWFFDNFHNWSFLNTISSNTWRIVVMLICLGIIILSALSGIMVYGFLWKKLKPQKKVANRRTILRKYHRQVGIAVAFVTVAFAFSGAYHATRKLNPNRLPEMVYEPLIQTDELQMASLSLPIDWKRFTNMSVVKKEEDVFFQVFYRKTEEKNQEVAYFNAKNGQLWENGDISYAKFLANKFAKRLCSSESTHGSCCTMSQPETPLLQEEKLLKAEMVYAFEQREYGFIFKRLPVIRLAYDMPEKDTYYIETATSRLAAHIDNSDRMEGYSFAIFHKFLLMDWAGKTIRDLTMMFASMGVLAISLLGLALYLKK